ncbi:MAG: VWA domain-containing protein [Chloroflexi bacterium]|nr:VWA domain-containing protein [Chloroflexota bacterium]
MMWLALLLVLALVTGAVAQTGSPFVTITGVDDQAFPQVVAYVAVSGADGSPLTDPTQAAFSVFEDEAEVSAAAISVQKQALRDLHLVLALDTSVPVDALANFKTAAKALLETMEPWDKIALVTFGDEAKVTHDFTNNKAELQATIEALTIQGDKTALNEAISDAVQLGAELSAGRNAVIILTDSKDNTGAVATTDQIANEAQTARLPLYPVGFGSKIQPEVLRDLAGRTGGQAFILSGSNEAQATLLKIAELLRQGYRVTFQSALKADNAEHGLSIRVTYQGGEGQAETRFSAVPGTVSVTLPNLTNGQMAEGVVNLTAQATAPAAIASVEYLLDGQSLVKLTTPPFQFDWDSATVKPGSHTLAAKVIDSAGNEGQTEASLNVAPRLAVTVLTAQEQINLGQPLPIAAKIETATPIVKVEFWLDGILLGSSSAPPYGFRLDSNKYAVGKHTVTVRVEDSLGHKAENSAAIEFLPPLPRQPTWSERILRWSLIIIMVLLTIAAIIGLFLLYRSIIGWQRSRRRGKYQLAIANLGNAPSQYELWATDMVGALKFQFNLNGVPLQPQPAGDIVETGEPVSYTETAAVAPTPAPPQVVPATRTGPSASSSLASARQASEGVMNTGSAMADLLTTVAYLLPGSLGNSLRGTANQILQRQGQISQVTRTPGMMARRAKQLPGQAGRVLPAMPTARTGASPVKTAIPAVGAAMPSTRTNGPSALPATARRSGATAAQESAQPKVQTPVVEPDRTLMIDLLITSLKPYRTQDYSFTVTSVSLEQAEAAPLTEQGQVYIKGISWLARLLPILFTVVTVVAVLLLAAYIVLWLAGADLTNWPLVGRLVATIFLAPISFCGSSGHIE